MRTFVGQCQTLRAIIQDPATHRQLEHTDAPLPKIRSEVEQKLNEQRKLRKLRIAWSVGWCF